MLFVWDHSASPPSPADSAKRLNNIFVPSPWSRPTPDERVCTRYKSLHPLLEFASITRVCIRYKSLHPLQEFASLCSNYFISREITIFLVTFESLLNLHVWLFQASGTSKIESAIIFWPIGIESRPVASIKWQFHEDFDVFLRFFYFLGSPFLFW